MVDVMKADVMTPHSTVGLNRDVIKPPPEEVVTKDVGLKADAMSLNSMSKTPSGGALYIMFENHMRSWPLLKTP